MKKCTGNVMPIYQQIKQSGWIFNEDDKDLRYETQIINKEIATVCVDCKLNPCKDDYAARKEQALKILVEKSYE